MRQETKGVVHLIGDDRELEVFVEPVFDRYGKFELERVWEVLGDHDVIQIDEINPGLQSNLALDSGEYVYFITPDNWEELKNTGHTTLDYRGKLDEFIDPSLPSHIDFLKWLNNE